MCGGRGQQERNMRRTLVWVAVVVCAAATACSSTPTPTNATNAPSTPASQPSDPTPAPARTKAQDAADLKKALVTARDLGSPWVQPRAVPTVKGKKNEICPGHVSASRKVPVTATASVGLTEGSGAGKNIAAFSLSTLPDENDSALAAAYQDDELACSTYRDASGLFLVRSIEGPSSVDKASLVAAWAERIYYDKQHHKLAYARHNLVARQGRTVTYLSYAFLTVRQDPRANDFTRATRVLQVQLAKNAKVFA
jgi:hypothetical protein